VDVRRPSRAAPLFSVCIPQYNRTAFLLEALRSVAGQTCPDVELCVSDDCSTDGREAEVVAFLESTGRPFAYHRRPRNGRYDANLRSAIGLARGRYCFLLGNDDVLAAPTTLADVQADLAPHEPPGLVVSNYEDFATGRRYARVARSGALGRGPHAAVRTFRNLSFVSGLLLDRERAQAAATARWDGSEMYQMFLGCRIVAEGAEARGLERVTVRKDLRIPGQRVDSYATRPRLARCPIEERRIPLTVMGRLVADAVAGGAGPAGEARLAERILAQILLYTYPFWILEYRRVQSWRYAVGVCLGMRPRNITRGLALGWPGRVRVGALYALATAAGLCAPLRAFDRLYPALYALAKRGPAPAEPA
jgi:hypothetical protein